jgi:hypothetical protein
LTLIPDFTTAVVGAQTNEAYGHPNAIADVVRVRRVLDFRGLIERMKNGRERMKPPPINKWLIAARQGRRHTGVCSFPPVIRDLGKGCF